MIKFLTTQGINYHLEELLKNATSKIILISPYIQLQRRIKAILKEQKQKGIEISIVCKKKDLKESITEYSTNIFDVPTLHAKCYMNEQEAIITSLNLYEFSQQNNEEMGVYVKNESSGRALYTEILKNTNRLYANHLYSKNSILLKIGINYPLRDLDKEFDFDFKKPSGIKKSKWGDIFLFSSTSSPYPDGQKNGTFYFIGQNTGTDKQKLIYGNKDLYDTYKNTEIKIYLFKDYVYMGEHTLAEQPFEKNGQWVFPLILSKPQC